MRKKLSYTILFVIFFSSIVISPLSVKGSNYSFKFSEIGSILPTSSVINFQCADNELMFILDISNGLIVVNTSDPYNIIELESIYLNFVHDIELDFDRKLAYVTAFNGVNIFSYANPSDLQLVSVYFNYTQSTSIKLRDELLFVGAEDCGLQIVNVSDSSNPVLIGQWFDPVGDVGAIYLKDDYAFVATRIPNAGAPPTYLDLKILDISNPTNITYVSTVDVGDNYNGGGPRAHKDDLVYFNDHAFGLKILNFSSPTDVYVEGNFSDDGFYNDLELIDNDIVALADDYFGVKIVDCSNPELPVLIDSYEHEWRTLRVAIKGTMLYVATLSGGIRILNMTIKTRGMSINPLLVISSLLLVNVIFIIFNKKKQ